MNNLDCKICGSGTEIVNQSHNLLKCSNCELIFSSKNFSQQEIEGLYEELYNAKDPIYKRRTVHEFDQIRAGKIPISYNRKLLLDKTIPKTRNILEIGAGIGTIGKYIQKSFHGKNYTGIELDTRTAEKARTLGINVLEGDFSILGGLHQKYDLIMMWEVMEHIQDLKSCLELIYEHTEAGGTFLFSVPNFNKKNNYHSDKDILHQVGPPIHLNFFTVSSLNKILSDHGFKVKNIRVKRLPYFTARKSFIKMLPLIIRGRYEGPTIFGIAEKI